MSYYELPNTPITCKNLVDNKWVESKSKTIDVLSPYNGDVIGKVPMCTAAEVATVVSTAKAAADAWRLTPIKERSAKLVTLRGLMERDIVRLSNTAAAEAGKTVPEARAGVMKGIEVIDYALSLQNMDAGGVLEVSRGVTCEYRREPLGVVAGIVPFNFPAMVPCWMFPIALTLGNAFILKPSEKVPLTSQILGELIVEAGFPQGIFSMINGGQECVEALIDNEDVKAIGFVGSTAIAKKVFQRATSHSKRCLALGGAKNPLIVVPDADENVTVPGVVDSFTGCAGQRCMAASLMIGVGDVDHLIKEIVAKASDITLGDNMGAIIDQASLDRINGVLDRAPKEGAKIILDGRKAPLPKGCEKGTWIGPTIIEADPSMECATLEIFGPVMTIVRVKTLNEAMEIEKKNPYGNACSVFTTNGGVARHVAHNATAGMTGVNIGVPVPREPFSFGGTKDSKIGQGDITGEGSLDFWTQRKKMTVKWAVAEDSNWMS